jgi:hypothetical protein
MIGPEENPLYDEPIGAQKLKSCGSAREETFGMGAWSTHPSKTEQVAAGAIFLIRRK